LLQNHDCHYFYFGDSLEQFIAYYWTFWCVKPPNFQCFDWFNNKHQYVWMYGCVWMYWLIYWCYFTAKVTNICYEYMFLLTVVYMLFCWIIIFAQINKCKSFHYHVNINFQGFKSCSIFSFVKHPLSFDQHSWRLFFL